MSSKILEVIVTSAHEAVEAEIGGADRVEIVRRLDLGGLTPELSVVREILARVSIPVRVMLRENDSMSIADPTELQLLRSQALQFAALPIDGFVLGFIKDDSIDADALNSLLRLAPAQRATFHRAFEALPDPLSAIQLLKSFPQIDRILTNGGDGSWDERKQRLLKWQQAASPEILMLVAAGESAASVLADLRNEPTLSEFHVGRAARLPAATFAPVSSDRVSALKGVLA